MSSGSRQPVMFDVARVAGVSPMTVSRVLSGYPGVKPETRAKVEQAIRLLDYTVHQAARTLASGRSRSIGVVSIGTPLYGPSGTLSGIEAAARKADHVVNVAILHEMDEPGLKQALQTLRSAQVDGFIVTAPVRATLDALAGMDVPEPLVVLYGGRAARWETVGIDQRRGARLATRHLLELGHRTVHHIRGPRDWIDADDREAGWRAELAKWGIEAPAPLTGDWSSGSGYHLGRHLAALKDVTAVFVANDQMAMGLLLALHEMRRSVPRDVSVVGFDDTPESEYTIPPLTTVRQDFTELGETAVQTLITAFEGGEARRRTLTRPLLVARRSTAPSRLPAGR